jgi:hypothetical protein
MEGAYKRIPEPLVALKNAIETPAVPSMKSILSLPLISPFLYLLFLAAAFLCARPIEPSEWRRLDPPVIAIFDADEEPVENPKYLVLTRTNAVFSITPEGATVEISWDEPPASLSSTGSVHLRISQAARPQSASMRSGTVGMK